MKQRTRKMGKGRNRKKMKGNKSEIEKEINL